MYTILYVDDEPDLLDIAKMYLEETGLFTVETAGSAHEAQEKLAKREFDAIIADYQMPKMNGIEFLKYVRQKYGKIPFILFTGKGREEVVIEAINNGADYYLQKYGNPDSLFAELIHRLRQAMQHRHVELIIRTNEERLRKAQAMGNTGCWEYDIRSGLMWGSEEGFRIFGYSQPAGDIRIEQIEDRITERERVHQALVDLIDRETEYNIEYTVNPANGGPPRIINSRAELERDAAGNPVKVVGVIQDITEHKQTEMQLVESQQRLTDIINFLPDATFVIDSEGKVIAWNKAIEEITGVTAAQILGRGNYEYALPFYGCRRPLLIDLIFKDSNEVQYLNFQNMGKTLIAEAHVPGLYQGKGAYLWGKASPLYDRFGRLAGAIESIRDITDRKISEDAVNQANRKLQLLSSITRHDTLNKVTVILGNLRSAKKKTEDPEIVKILDKIDSTTKVIRSQIEFTRIYQELGSHEPRWQNLDAVIPPSSIPHGIIFTAAVEDIEISADPMLERVFYNLIDNSLRHGQHVTAIRTWCRESDDGLHVFFEDNGVGIPAEDKEQIFERGYGKNSGLGLFLVREILSITGITLTENGTEGQGARFEIVVPRDVFRRKRDADQKSKTENKCR